MIGTFFGRAAILVQLSVSAQALDSFWVHSSHKRPKKQHVKSCRRLASGLLLLFHRSCSQRSNAGEPMKTTSLMPKIQFLAMAFLFWGCASGAAKQKEQTGQENAARNVSTVDQNSCEQTADDSMTNRGTISPALRNKPVGSWIVSDASGGRLLNLCQVLKESGKKAAVFQFAGVTCVTCRAESKEFENSIRKANLEDDVLHVIVFTDRQREYDEQSFREFMQQYAPKSLRLHDDDGLLWKALNRNSVVPDRGVVAGLGMNGKDAFSDVEGKVLDIWPEVMALARDSK